jgi:hypothetical protein
MAHPATTKEHHDHHEAITEPQIDRNPWKLAANGIVDRLETLVQEGVDINQKDEQGVAPLVQHK